MLCIVLNGIFARVNPSPPDSGYLSALSSACSTLTQAFSLTALPLAVMNSYAASPAVAEQSRHAASSQPTEATASPDDALTNPAQWMIITVDTARRHVFSTPGMPGVPGPAALLTAGHMSAAPPGAPPFPLIVLLILLCLLPRSGLSDAWGYLCALGRISLPVAVARAGFFVVRRFQRTVALVTLACFVLTMMPLDGFAALTTPRQPIPPIATDAPGALAIPAALGTVTESHITGGDRLIVAIQDLHCHAEVQKNIRDIIALLDKERALTAVYLEGASGDVDTSWLGAVENQRLKRDLTDALLAQGAMTGTEAYAVMSGKHHFIKGLEDEALYESNVRRLNSMFKTRADTDAIVARMRGQTATMAAVYYGDKNRRFEKLISKGREGAFSQKQYHALLRKYALRSGIDVSSYRNLSVYRDLMDDSGRIHFARVNEQMQELVNLLKKRLPYSAFNNLLERTDNFRDAEKIVPLLARLNEEHPGAADLSRDFPAVAAYVSYVMRGRTLNPVMLVREENKLISDIQSRHAASGSERDVVFLTRYLEALDGYLANKVSSEECAFVEKNQQRFRSLWELYADVSDLDQLEPCLQTVRDFYRVNHQRNTCFIDSMKLDVPGIQAATSAPIGRPAVSVAVMGGFHTDGFTALLRQRGISYVVVTPAVTGGTGRAEKIYRAAMEQQALFPTQTMAVKALAENPHDQLHQAVLTAYIVERLAAQASEDVINQGINDELKRVFPPEYNNAASNISFSLDKRSGKNFAFTIANSVINGGKPTHFIFNDGIVTVVDSVEKTASGSLFSRIKDALRKIPRERIMRDVVKQPLKELGFFFGPQLLFLLTGNPLGFGLAIGLSYIIFSSWHIVHKAQSEKDLPPNQQRYGAHAFRHVLTDFLAFGIPFMVFTGIFSVALPLGLPGAAAASFATHSFWNVSYLLFDAYGRAPPWMRLASIVGVEQAPPVSETDANAAVVSAIKSVFEQSLHDTTWRTALNITDVGDDNVIIFIQRRNDAFEFPQHLTRMNVEKITDESGNTLCEITLDMHPVLWEALLKGQTPPGMTREEFIKHLIDYQTDYWSACNNKESKLYEPFGNFLSESAGYTDNQQVRTHEAYARFVSAQMKKPKDSDIAQRFHLQSDSVHFVSLLVKQITEQTNEITFKNVTTLVRQRREISEDSIIFRAHEALVRKHGKNTPTYAHAVRVAWSLAKWGADDDTIAAAFLRQGVPTNSDFSNAIDIFERFRSVNAREYVGVKHDKVFVSRLVGPNSHQNYLDLLVQVATKPTDDPKTDKLSAGALLLTFAEKLWTLDEARKDESKSRQMYLYAEMEQVIVTLAMRIDYVEIANDLRDTALRLLDPEQYEKFHESIVLYLGQSRAEAEKTFGDKRKSLKKELKGRFPGVRILKRIKGVKSAQEKLTSDRTEHDSFEQLSDVLGMHIIIDDSDQLSDAADAVRNWIQQNNYTYAGQVLNTQADLGYTRLKINFIDDRLMKYEVVINTDREYRKYRFGLTDELTFNASIPHWIYKLGPKVMKIMGEFIMEIKFVTGRTAKQAYRADNLKYSGELHERFNQLRKRTKNDIYVQCYLGDSASGGGMAVLKLPIGAIVADVLAAPEIAGISSEMASTVTRITSDGKDTKVLNLHDPLSTGDVISLAASGPKVSREDWSTIAHQATTPRAKLLARMALDNKDDSYYEVLRASAKGWLGGYANDPILMEILRRECDFVDDNELFYAIGHARMEQGQLGFNDKFLEMVEKKLLEMTRRVVTVNISPEWIQGLQNLYGTEEGFNVIRKTEEIIGKRLRAVPGISEHVTVQHSSSGRAPYLFNISLRQSSLQDSVFLVNFMLRAVLGQFGDVEVHNISDQIHYQMLTNDISDKLNDIAKIHLGAQQKEFKISVKIDDEELAGDAGVENLMHWSYDPAGNSMVFYVNIHLLNAIIEEPSDRSGWAARIAQYKMLEAVALNMPASVIAQQYLAYQAKYENTTFREYFEDQSTQVKGMIFDDLVQVRAVISDKDHKVQEAIQRLSTNLYDAALRSFTGTGPANIASTITEHVAGDVAVSVPDELNGKTVYQYVNGELDQAEAMALDGRSFSHVYIMPAKPTGAKNMDAPVGPKLRISREGIPVVLQVYSGMAGSARIISVPDLRPSEVPELIQWLANNPQLSDVGQPLAGLTPPTEGAYIIEFDAVDQYGDAPAQCPVVVRGIPLATQESQENLPPLVTIEEKGLPPSSRPEEHIQALEDLFIDYAAAFTLHAAEAVMRPGINGENIDVAALSEKDAKKDPGTGELTDITSYIEKARKVVPEVGMFLVEAFTEKNDATRGDHALIDLTDKNLTEVPALKDKSEATQEKDAVVEQKNGILKNAYAFLNEHGERKESFDGFVAGELSALGDFAPQVPLEQYAQWLFFTQLRDAVRAAHAKDSEISFRIRIGENTADKDIAAIAYWFQAGFDGIRIDIDDNAKTPDTIKRVQIAVQNARPNARFLWSSPVTDAAGVVIQPFDALNKGTINQTVMIEMDSTDLANENADETGVGGAAGLILPAGSSQGVRIENGRLPREGDLNATRIPEGSTVLGRFVSRVSSRQPQTPAEWYRAGRILGERLPHFAAQLSPADSSALYTHVARESIDPLAVNSVVKQISDIIDRVLQNPAVDHVAATAAKSWVARVSAGSPDTTAAALAGLTRGLLETSAEQRYVVQPNAALPGDPADKSALRTLLMMAEGFNIHIDDELLPVARTASADRSVASAFNYIKEHGQDSNVSAVQLEREVRAIISPLLKKLSDDGTLPTNDAATVEALIYLLKLFADPNLPSVLDSVKRSTAPAGKQLAAILSAA